MLNGNAPSAVGDAGAIRQPVHAIGVFGVAQVRDVLKSDLKLTARVRLDPAELQIVADAEIDLHRQLRRPIRLSIDGESCIAEPQIFAEVDVLDSCSNSRWVPIEEVADVDTFALVVPGANPGRASSEPRNSLDVDVEIGEGHRRAGSGRTEVGRGDAGRRVADIRVRYEGRRHEV